MSAVQTDKATVSHDMPYEQYRGIRALNQSTLKLMDRDAPYGASPLHAKSVFDGKLERDDTLALRMGRAEHCWIVEGEKSFRQRFRVAPAACEAVKKDGNRCTNQPTKTAAGQWYCGVKGHAPAGAEEISDFVNATDFERIRAVAESVHRHPIGKHCRRPGWSEYTIKYTVPVSFVTLHCPKCGVGDLPDDKGEVPAASQWFRHRGPVTTCRKCEGEFPAPETREHDVVMPHKVRIDRLAQQYKGLPYLAIDLKRMPVMEGKRWKREKAIERYGWDVQAAMYIEAVMTAFGANRCDFCWVFVEEKYPHDVVWFPAGRDTIAIGADKLRRYRQQWAACDHLDYWPGYCISDQQPGGLSEYYVSRYYEQHGIIK